MSLTYLPTRPSRMSLETLAVRSGLHPELIARLVALSLLDAYTDENGQLWFRPNAPATLARIQRLHVGLPVNYAAIGLILDLLNRIEALEAELRTRSRTSWT
jgi:hypothetical protein